MWVQPEVLRDGSEVAKSAAEIALNGANALDQAAIPTGMFGDFEAAHTFHSKLAAGHATHVQAMRGNHTTLADVGAKARRSAALFQSREAQNTTEVRSVGDG